MLLLVLVELVFAQPLQVAECFMLVAEVVQELTQLHLLAEVVQAVGVLAVFQ
jgi:hypothetical protein